MINFINKGISMEMLKTATKATLIGTSCLLLVSGCGNSMSNYSGVEQQNRNIVEMVRVPFTLNFEANNSTLNSDEINKLNYFLRTSNVTYGDEFSMDFPLDRNGDISDLNSSRLNYVSDLLKNSGLYLSASLTPYGMEPKENSGRLLISKYVVTPPNCGNWSQPSNPNYENAPLSELGCSSQANLGMMVANPRDLITGQSGGSTNAERAALAVERYQSAVVEVSTESSTSGVTN